jgi:hypothetical protein
MRLQFAVIAQSVALDSITGRLSIFNVCETITSPRFPIFMPEIVFIAVLRREPTEPETFDTSLSIHLGKNAIGQANLHVDFQGQLLNRQTVIFRGCRYLLRGTYDSASIFRMAMWLMQSCLLFKLHLKPSQVCKNLPISGVSAFSASNKDGRSRARSEVHPR